MGNSRKVISIIGIFLIGLGIFALVSDQRTYTKREKIIDIGPIEASVEKEVPRERMPTILGVLTIVAGGALLLIQFRRR